MRSRSSVVGPGRRPWSPSACRTQLRSVSPEQPIFSAIERIAAHCEACSPWWSRTIRTARARTSGEYGGTRFVMAPSSQELEPPENPVRFNQHQHRDQKFAAGDAEDAADQPDVQAEFSYDPLLVNGPKASLGATGPLGFSTGADEGMRS